MQRPRGRSRNLDCDAGGGQSRLDCVIVVIGTVKDDFLNTSQPIIAHPEFDRQRKNETIEDIFCIWVGAIAEFGIYITRLRVVINRPDHFDNDVYAISCKYYGSAGLIMNFHGGFYLPAAGGAPFQKLLTFRLKVHKKEFEGFF